MQKVTLRHYAGIFIVTLLSILFQAWVVKETKVTFLGLLYPITFIVAWKYGWRPALFTIVMASVATVFFIFDAQYSFKILNFWQVIPLLIYAVTSGICSWIVVRGQKWNKEGPAAISALSTLQSRFSRSSHAINLGIWYCDLPFDELIWDKHTKDHFWLPEDAKVTIDTFYERIHPDDRQMTKDAIDASIRTNGPYDIVYRTTNPQNTSEIKYIRAIGWTDYDGKGNPIRFDGITLDHTSIKKTSEDLRESLEVVEKINKVGTSLSAELDQKKLVQQVTDAATQLSKAEFGAFFYNLVNEKGESYTLYTVSGVPIENFSKFPMPRNTAVFAPTFAGEGIIRSDDITKDPRYGKNDTYHGMPKGHLPVVSYLAVPVMSRTGEVIGGLFLGHKEKGVFTEREEKIVAGLASQIAIAMDNARLFEQANQAIKLRDEFLSISSHELKTPLTSLKMQLQLFSHIMKQDQGPVPEERVKKIVDVSERQVNRLNSLVEDLLDVTRISSGKLSLNLEKVDLPELVGEVVERYLPLLRQTKCTLEVHTAKNLTATVDRIRFEQILINLISNSMKYAPDSRINVTLEEVGGNIHLVVKDNGPGIHPEDQGRVFNRFERSSKEGKGLGLGLYIVHQIVEAHGGTIKLKSDVGQGAEFSISIPVK